MLVLINVLVNISILKNVTFGINILTCNTTVRVICRLELLSETS